MQLIPRRIEATLTVSNEVSSFSSRVSGAETRPTVGPLEIRFSFTSTQMEWALANSGDESIRVRSVSFVFEVADVVEPLRIFRNGYQSWSPTAVATLGVDVDPSVLADFEFLQATQHADQHRAQAGELRSEWVTLLADCRTSGTNRPLLVGLDGGHEHDGTLRLRSDGQRIELWAEAFLGDAVVASGEQRTLHGLIFDDGDDTDGPSKLTAWAKAVGSQHGARVQAPYQVGWCSWYQYFHDVTESHLRKNLALAEDWPFEVFQLDDGYQRAIGDWLSTNERFPSGLDGIASAIAAEGRIPGLWLAPFLVAPDSETATAQPDWIARQVVAGTDRGPLRKWWNPPWGGGQGGFMYGLDTTHPEVQAHLESLAANLVDAGFNYLKLDFTFSPSVGGGYTDGTRTPAQRVRAGYQAIRKGAGDDVFLLGCGVPLSNVVGVVDANRIGQDVAPTWALEASEEVVAGYVDVQPATQRAYVNTLTRAFMHRSLWLNDPDCIMLRTKNTRLTPSAVRTWANTVAVSGGMALVSDDLALLDAQARQLLDEVVARGRASDAEAIHGFPAHCDDLLDQALPTHFVAGDYELRTEPAQGDSVLRRL